MNRSDPGLTRAMGQARLRHHHAVIGSALGASALIGVALVALLWNHAPHGLLLGWLSALSVVLALRLAFDRAARLANGAETRHEHWLLRIRLAYLLHGLAWASAMPLLGGRLDGEPLDLLVFTVTAIAAGAVATTAFDLAAAALFAVPALVPLLWCMFAAEGGNRALGTVVLLIIMAVGGSARRNGRLAQEAVRMQLAAAARADEALHLAKAADDARRQLADQHQLLTQLLHGTRQGCWFIDNTGVTTDVNPAMCELLGRPREQILGRSAFEFFSGSDLETLQREVAARDAGHGGGYEVDILRPDGTRRRGHNNATPIYDTQGQRVGSVGLWTDLTAHAQLEATLRTYELVTNAITDMVSVIGEDRIYRMVNDAWVRSVGVARESALGSLARDVLPSLSTAPRVAALADCLRLQQVRTVCTPVDLPTLRGRLMETSYFPYGKDVTGVPCVVLVTRDVTEREQGREALATGAEYLRRTLNATGDAIYASDSEDQREPVRFVNEQMLQMWGIAAERMAHLTPEDILAHAMPLFVDVEAELRRIESIIAGHRADESRLTLNDGRVLLRRCVPAGRPGSSFRVWSFRDITAEVRALEDVRASEAEHRSLLEAFPGYIAAFDDRHVYTFLNERCAALLGRPAGELIGRATPQALLDADTWPLIRSALDAAQRGERTVIERIYPAAGPIPALALALEVTYLAGPPQRDGRRISYAFGTDITAGKLAKAELTAARDDAERGNAAKSRFLSQMSHELRTPLNAILGFAQLLGDDLRAPLAKGQQGHVAEILRGGRHLLALINELLDLGRIEADQLALQPAPLTLGPLVAECLALVLPLARQHDVRLLPPAGVDEAAAVLADAMRLRQVLLNLLGNAIKYNRPGGEVEVLCARDGPQCVLTVRDSGAGIDAASCERLFRPFERLEAGRTAIEGTGIGLALSRRLVNAMGGSIGVESQPGVGSRFWVRLPQATVAALPAPPPELHAAQQPLPGAAATVLYVEDNPVNTLLMEAMLEDEPGLRLLLAALPGEGLEIARRERLSLVLLDIQMPGMNGFEVLARLRADPRTRAVPVIAVSANARAEDIERARAAGFNAYLTKPIDLNLLLHTVRTALAGAAVG